MAMITPERLVRVLWGEVEVLRGALSLLSIERIAGPWSWHGQDQVRRDLMGRIVALLPMIRPGGAAFVEGYVGRTPITTRKGADCALRAQGWVLFDLPRIGPWVPDQAAMVRKTSTGTEVARITPSAGGYILTSKFGEAPIAFNGPLEDAKYALNSTLTAAGFPEHERCVGCGAVDEELLGPCVSETISHRPVAVDWLEG